MKSVRPLQWLFDCQKLNSPSLRDRMPSLRERMLHETERYLNQHLSGRAESLLPIQRSPRRRARRLAPIPAAGVLDVEPRRVDRATLFSRGEQRIERAAG